MPAETREALMFMAVTVVAVFLLALALTAWLARPDAPIRILDRPNERSLHSRPTPRTGGIAICVTLLSAWMLAWFAEPVSSIPVQILQGTLIVAAVALIDDRFGLSPLIRILVQFAAALALIRGGFLLQGELLPGISMPGHAGVAAAMTLVLTLWLINLYNFMDGMDGFSGGMALIGFGALAILGLKQGDTAFAGAALTICAASAGFLWFNFPPARIFMGDTGSTTLGLLVAGFTVWGGRSQIAAPWITLAIFSPFVMDATVTLLRRAARGEAVWRAHRSHYYQRLVQLGWGHRRTVLAEYVLMFICATAALTAQGQTRETQWLILATLGGGYLTVAMLVHKLERLKNDLDHS